MEGKHLCIFVKDNSQMKAPLSVWVNAEQDTSNCEKLDAANKNLIISHDRSLKEKRHGINSANFSQNLQYFAKIIEFSSKNEMDYNGFLFQNNQL